MHIVGCKQLMLLLAQCIFITGSSDKLSYHWTKNNISNNGQTQISPSSHFKITWQVTSSSSPFLNLVIKYKNSILSFRTMTCRRWKWTTITTGWAWATPTVGRWTCRASRLRCRCRRAVVNKKTAQSIYLSDRIK